MARGPQPVRSHRGVWRQRWGRGDGKAGSAHCLRGAAGPGPSVSTRPSSGPAAAVGAAPRPALARPVPLTARSARAGWKRTWPPPPRPRTERTGEAPRRAAPCGSRGTGRAPAARPAPLVPVEAHGAPRRAPFCSVDVDAESKKLLGLGQKHLVMGNIPAAVNAFQEAASLL